MEINVQLLEPNVLYLDEKPPKIVKNTKGAKKTAKKKVKVDKSKAKLRKSKKSKAGRDVAIKPESQSKANEETRGQTEDSTVVDDPLYTSDKPIKMEVDSAEEEENKKESKSLHEDFKNSDYEADMDDYSLEAEELCVAKLECAEDEYEEAEEEGDDDEEEDFEDDEEDYKDSDEDGDGEEDAYDDDDEEPLIMIAQRKGRPRKRKIPRLQRCGDSCKEKCIQKLTEEHRQTICNLFWSLSDEDKKLYIRQHTKTKPKRYTRVKRKTTKGYVSHLVFFLDNDNSVDTAEGGNSIRVCRKYFESTLRTTSYTIKKAMEGYEPEMEVIVKPKPSEGQQNSSLEKKPKEATEKVVQQFLDPETGNLVTKKPSTSTAKPKGKRKPGDPQPEHNPKPIKCEQRCIFKCHKNFTEEERKQICDVFWSLDYNRRKDFILARIETKDIEMQTTPEFRTTNRPPRTYHTRFFLRSGIKGENTRVCKHFMMNTLSISKMFIRNAIDFADKTTGHYTGLDRRGLNSAANKIGPDRLQFIKDHIASHPTWIPYKKSKTRYLHHTLSIKRMHVAYKELCTANGMKFVSTNIYYKSFHEDFRLMFLSKPETRRGFLKANPNVSQYTGEEPGGVWLDPKGEKLDLNVYDPAQSFMSLARLQQQPIPASVVQQETSVSPEESMHSMEASTAAPPPPPPPPSVQETVAAQTSSFAFNQSSFNYAHLLDPALNANLLCPPAVATAIQHEFNLNLYDNTNLPHAAHAASSSSLFRKL